MPDSFTSQLLAILAPTTTERSERFCRRLDAHLPCLASDGARRAFLAAEREKWMANYQAWASKIDNGTATDLELTYSAHDFVLTIAEIGKRLAALSALEAV